MSETAVKDTNRELQRLREIQKNDLDETTASADQQYLTFLLKNEVYGIEILSVKEIITYGTLTDIPLVHPCIEGVINLRGNVVPVINLQIRFDHPASDITKLTSVIVVEIGEEGDKQEMGIVVDAVDEVVNIADKDINPVPAFGVSIPQEYIIGMGKVDGNFIMLLNIYRILDVDELANLKHKRRGKRVKKKLLGTSSETSSKDSLTTHDGIFFDTVE